jgi:hypothetical protein
MNPPDPAWVSSSIPQRVSILFCDRVSGSIVLDGNPSQWKPIALLTKWLADNRHLNHFSRREWQFSEVDLASFIDCRVNSNCVHMPDDTLQV